jgi:hypothetical protein
MASNMYWVAGAAVGIAEGAGYALSELLPGGAKLARLAGLQPKRGVRWGGGCTRRGGVLRTKHAGAGRNAARPRRPARYARRAVAHSLVDLAGRAVILHALKLGPGVPPNKYAGGRAGRDARHCVRHPPRRSGHGVRQRPGRRPGRRGARVHRRRHHDGCGGRGDFRRQGHAAHGAHGLADPAASELGSGVMRSTGLGRPKALAGALTPQACRVCTALPEQAHAATRAPPAPTRAPAASAASPWTTLRPLPRPRIRTWAILRQRGPLARSSSSSSSGHGTRRRQRQRQRQQAASRLRRPRCGCRS